MGNHDSEILDVVDKNGNVVGTASREECHMNPKLIHRTAHFTLIDKKNNKILLTQRSFTKDCDPGKFCFLGEHALSGETPSEAMIRGAKEELGVNIFNPIELGKNIFSYQQQTELATFYIAELKDEKISFDKDEIVQAFWISLEDLHSSTLDIPPISKYWIENAQWEKIFPK